MQERKICTGNCCGIVPLPKETVKQFEHLQQREVTEVLEYAGMIIPITDGLHCVFLDSNYQCVIYEHRPDVCKNYGIIEKLPCPFLKPNGSPRSPAMQKRIMRQINREVDAKMIKRRFLYGI